MFMVFKKPCMYHYWNLVWIMYFFCGVLCLHINREHSLQKEKEETGIFCGCLLRNNKKCLFILFNQIISAQTNVTALAGEADQQTGDLSEVTDFPFYLIHMILYLYIPFLRAQRLSSKVWGVICVIFSSHNFSNNPLAIHFILPTIMQAQYVILRAQCAIMWTQNAYCVYDVPLCGHNMSSCRHNIHIQF